MDARRLIRLSLALVLLPAGAGALDVELVNRTTIVAPMDTNGHSDPAAGITPDGRHTLFRSLANNLVAGDTNRVADLFIHDATTGTIERINVSSAGTQSGAAVGSVAGISDDGRYVVFHSSAQDLVATPTFGISQVYLRDRTAGTTTLLSRFGANAAAVDSANPRLSADGNQVVFDSAAAFDIEDTNGVRDVYQLNRQTGVFTLISTTDDGRIGNGRSYEPQISADGSAVVFYSDATNLVPGDTNVNWDLILRKPLAGTTQRVNVRTDGTQVPNSFPYLSSTNALSGDGRFVLMNSYDALEPSDTNDRPDGYVYDSQDGSIRRVTLGAGNTQISGFTMSNGLSRDGTRLMFDAQAADVVPGQPLGNYRAYRRDIGTGAVTHVTFRAGNELVGDDAWSPVMSDDGNTVVALTYNGSFVVGDSNNMKDLIRQAAPGVDAQRVTSPLTGSTQSAANHDSGAYFQGHSSAADARFVAFGSSASNLVAGDLNGADDIFVRDRLLGTTERVSVFSNGTEGYCGSFSPSISDDGRYVVFYSCTPFDIPTPTFRMDVYRHDRLLHTTALVSRTHTGAAPDSASTSPTQSADARFVAFVSCATDLIPGDVNGMCDAFVRDMDTNVTTLATPSIDADGANDHTSSAWISDNGQHVFFASSATDLVAGDTNAATDVFAFHRGSPSVERVSVNSQGLQADDYSEFADASADGRQVLFLSSAQNLDSQSPAFGMYVRDLDTGTTELVSRNNAGDPLEYATTPAAMSADGERVVFVTSALSAGPPEGFKLMLFERTPARLGLVRSLDPQFTFGPLRFVGNRLLVSSADNTFVADDANNHFSDVFLLDKIEDYLFANGFEPL